MSGLEFKSPLFLLLFLPYAIAAFLYLFFKLNKKEDSIKISSVKLIRKKKTIRGIIYPFLPLLRFVSIAILILIIARPGIGVDNTSVKNLGIDIMMIMDVSSSMRGEDFQPKNRLHVSKEVISGFIKNRSTDRIGLIVFAARPFLQCPLTLEYDMLDEIISEVDFDSVDADGTGIGDAIMLAVSRMKDRKSSSKIILLVTDGVNTAGSLLPQTAAQIAKEYGIKIYSVGIGKDGRVPYPTRNVFQKYVFVENQFDVETLEKISEISGGKFYRAESTGVFWENIKEIDALEKTEYDVKVYYEFFDRYYPLMIITSIIFFIEILLRSIVFRKVP